MEKANSFSVNGHKTLNIPHDSGIVLCKNREALTNALHVSVPYIRYSENRDGMLFNPEMSRRARAVELWAALKYLGREGVDKLVFGLHLRAVQMVQEFKSKGINILNHVVFNQVIVTCDNDEHTNKTMQYIQESGECWVIGANWYGKSVIRVSVCSWATTENDITRSVEVFAAARNKAGIELRNT